MTTISVTCATEGCENAGITIVVQPPLIDADLQRFFPASRIGDVYPGWSGVTCGPCGAQLHTNSEGQA